MTSSARLSARLVGTLKSEDGRFVYALEGEIDVTAANHLVERVVQAVESHPHRQIDLDMAGVSFMDSSVRALVRIREAVESRGGEMRLLSPSKDILRVLELTETPGLFPVVTSEVHPRGRTGS